MKTKNRSSLILPISVGVGLIVLVAVIATTNTFDSVIDYIHTNSITPIGIGLCILAAGFAFFTVFKILSKLGCNMLPDETNTKK